MDNIYNIIQMAWIEMISGRKRNFNAISFRKQQRIGYFNNYIVGSTVYSRYEVFSCLSKHLL